MTTAVCWAVLAIVAFAVLAPPLGRRLPPATATRSLAPATLAMAAATVFVLGVVAFTWLGQFPVIAALGPWSTSRLDATDPVPDPVAVASLVLLAVAAVRAVVRIVRALVAVRRAYADPRPAGDLIVLDSNRPEAFCTPPPAGRVVVTSALLRALPPSELRVVLAHEHSHLAHRHVWWKLAADLAAAVNPLLRRTATAVDHTVERWADEDAAVTVHNRRLVARAIARAALLRHGTDGSPDTVTPAATDGDVPGRVRALLAPPPRRRPIVLGALAIVLAVGTLATAAVELTGDQLFDHAGLYAGGPAEHHHVHRRIR
jgi:Peptidase family M48